MWTHSLGETSRKPKSKHHYISKHKISDNDKTFQNLTQTLEHLHLKENLQFHLNFQYGRHLSSRFQDNLKDPKLRLWIIQNRSITPDPEFFRRQDHLCSEEYNLFHLDFQYQQNPQSRFKANPNRVHFSAFFSTN